MFILANGIKKIIIWLKYFNIDVRLHVETRFTAKNIYIPEWKSNNRCNDDSFSF